MSSALMCGGVLADSRRVGCLGLTDAVEAESSSGSESNSPRHPDSGAELVRP